MKLQDTEKNWEIFAQKDPLWSILTDPAKYGNKWGIDEFFATGKGDMDRLFADLAKDGALPASVTKPSRALDFGCGVGRLTQALVGRFDEVWGVDISPSMIRQAKEYAEARSKQIIYIQNSANDLAMCKTGDFDFVCSLITLQHMEPRYGKNYIQEFIRMLKPGGVCVFQMPSHMSKKLGSLSLRLVHWAHRHMPAFLIPVARMIFLKKTKPINAVMEMHCVQKDEMVALLKANGAEVLKVAQDAAAGDFWVSYTYVLRKK